MCFGQTKPLCRRIPARGATATVDPGRPRAHGAGGRAVAVGSGRGAAAPQSEYGPLEALVGQSPVGHLSSVNASSRNAH